MHLFSILIGTLIAGVGSVLIARFLSPGASSRYAQDMLSFAAGALLSTAFLHLLPEAFDGGVAPKNLFAALLTGLVVFFVLDKAELWHHGHDHHTADHHHYTAPAGAWAVLLGDSIHCFGDGLLIAAAFTADVKLGVLASLAVLTHEVPHHLGDLAVLQLANGGRGNSTFKLASAGGITVAGGVAGYWLVEPFTPWLPYFLTAAASSFVYVALADLIPQLQKHAGRRQAVRHVLALVVGISVVALATTFDVS
jgi:zinc and cadmium transporter